jgi:hypothetical protein
VRSRRGQDLEAMGVQSLKSRIGRIVVSKIEQRTSALRFGSSWLLVTRLLRLSKEACLMHSPETVEGLARGTSDAELSRTKVLDQADHLG